MRVYDPVSGMTRTLDYDHARDELMVKTTQDCEAIIDHNKRLATWDDGYTPSREMRRVASIPLVIYQQWMSEDGVNLMTMPKGEKAAYLRKKLNDPDWRYLRTAPGVF